ncbi:ATP:guanido phosphotransferase YacI [Planctomycetales bacterium 10988]|nr:ATP:guanido phosphotransferase YacI [Planctomycetales bacterium 10988]
MQLDDLTRTSGEWLRGEGTDADIVMSSRIRLARNIAEYPFISRASQQDRVEIERMLHDCLQEKLSQDLLFLDINQLSALDRQFLVERHLISHEHADGEGPRSVALAMKERVSLMINEEDHLRIQVIASGLNLKEVWSEIDRIDDLIEEQLTYAYSSKLGYLTACPTNVGTGMRVSVMMHLPALAMTGEAEKVFRSLQKINLAVRGFFGEGSQAIGDFYQISNQITLGRSEEDLIQHVMDVIPVIIEYERKARNEWMEKRQEKLHDDISRAYAILQNTKTITSEETMTLLSKVRMGINLKLIDDLPIPSVNKLFLFTQPAHLQKLRGREMDKLDRDIERANYLRSHLNEASEGDVRNS